MPEIKCIEYTTALCWHSRDTEYNKNKSKVRYELMDKSNQNPYLKILIKMVPLTGLIKSQL